MYTENMPLRHFPTEAHETLPQGDLVAEGYVEFDGKPYSVFLAVPETYPRQGFAFDLESGHITDVISDLHRDHEARAAKKMDHALIGNFEYLSQKLIKAKSMVALEKINFNEALEKISVEDVRLKLKAV